MNYVSLLTDTNCISNNPGMPGGEYFSLDDKLKDTERVNEESLRPFMCKEKNF